MDVIYGLIPGMLVLGLVAVAVLFWAARNGQFDDLEGDGRRILMDEDEVDPRRFPDADPDSMPPTPRMGEAPDTRAEHSVKVKS
ncbi:cbb3-type cytochrome oxidase assembly protein CcoS [Lamprocystis purpurea]|jgi:cbb3-type cytochrome oxidase maturation protein|uniref:cbb3-type cytochrome oxidase assembly protein CcoS n=1 Tax=Lamprocystis purpurea TaxID=61598 RepID=UPI000364B7C6|nr:cbb3-type cytochrome oxidase assembly protein CcoS [Lamprocystis purpurea]